ncbi:MAG: SPOR domain-containing protein [Calditrichaeota bacterium]|nr:SPOR domain-containing protein [Calditrichota bacterium]
MRRFISFLALLGMFGMMACSSGVVRTPDRDRDRDADAGSSSSSVNEAFDPVKLNDEDLTFPEKDLQLSGARPLPLPGDRKNDALPAPPPAGPAPAVENRVIDGFRVQLFATKDNQAATLEKQEAEFVFSPDGVGVYIEFDSPMYKLRIGDCRTRDEAEELRELARQKGYPTSWIVKTKVNTNPALPQMNRSGPANSDNEY